MNRYLCELPIYGRAPHAVEVTAPNARAAAREASRVTDAYANRGRTPGSRTDRTPAAHWNCRRIGGSR